jgi:glucosyl-3-phosphoglycerate synthase
MAISLCLPARNEAATIGPLVAAGVAVPMVDEVVVIDDGSTDDTAAVARAAGARVVAEASILPGAGPGAGKGNVLWKSLYECSGEIICWIDADLRNFRGEYIERLCTPLLADDDVMFVKANYMRSFEGAPTGGGRVTELVARPLLSLLFPKLTDIAQPLGGEYAARRAALEVLPFVEGWGVELALLVDVVERFGRDAVVQVDLGTREHRNRPLEELAPQARAVMATALKRAELLDPVDVCERPPIVTQADYRARFGRLR